MAASDGVRSVRELPACFQPVHSAFRYYNAVQSESFPQAYGSTANLVSIRPTTLRPSRGVIGNQATILLTLQVLSAPTGAGKTGVLELCLLRLYLQHVQQDGSFQPPRGCLKALYLAPSLALVQVAAGLSQPLQAQPG